MERRLEEERDKGLERIKDSWSAKIYSHKQFLLTFQLQIHKKPNHNTISRHYETIAKAIVLLSRSHIRGEDITSLWDPQAHAYYRIGGTQDCAVHGTYHCTIH